VDAQFQVRGQSELAHGEPPASRSCSTPSPGASARPRRQRPQRGGSVGRHQGWSGCSARRST
jgi:hypothetical protein